jgi:hypothetical protein
MSPLDFFTSWSAFKDSLTFNYDLHCNGPEGHVKAIIKRAPSGIVMSA